MAKPSSGRAVEDAGRRGGGGGEGEVALERVGADEAAWAPSAARASWPAVAPRAQRAARRAAAHGAAGLAGAGRTGGGRSRSTARGRRGCRARCCRRRRAGGESVPMPSWPGSTARIPPATPLLAGRPTSKSHWPAKSYIPQVAITLSTLARARSSSAAHAGDRVDALVGEGRAHHRQVAAGDQDRALVEVEVEHGLGVVADHREVAQQVGDRAVAVAGVALGAVDVLVDRQPPAGVAAEGRRGCAPACAAGSAPRSSPVVAIAPALTIGLNGLPSRPAGGSS